MQVRYHHTGGKMEGAPRLQGMRQLVALSTVGWLPHVRCRCCLSWETFGAAGSIS